MRDVFFFEQAQGYMTPYWLIESLNRRNAFVSPWVSQSRVEEASSSTQCAHASPQLPRWTLGPGLR